MEMRKNTYQDDRNDSDEFFYNSEQVRELLKVSDLYGENIQQLKPAEKDDDNFKATDTWINGEFPAQIRVQFTGNKKIHEEGMHPTIRYSRLYNTTETRKLIKMYDGGEKIPHLIWIMACRKKKSIKKLIIVDLQKIFHKRKEKMELDEEYKLTNDYTEKKNRDGQTSFLVLNNEDDYIFTFIDSE